MPENNKIKQKDIHSAAWPACDTFRGVMELAAYKDYILVMLFLKYISDVFQDHYNEYKKQSGDDDIRIKRKLERERFILPESSSFYDLYEKRNEPNIGELINRALEVIETKNKSKLDGVFRNIDFNSESNLGKTKDRNRRLKMLLEDFNKPQLDMSPSKISEDVIDNTYIYLIERFASDAGKKAGEFFTPNKISKLVSLISNPKEGARICDPACGAGGLLIESAKAVGSSNYSLFGMEVNRSTWALARMNMFLNSCDSARIEWCNTLIAPTLTEDNSLMKFDNIVANSPFSLDKWGADEAQGNIFNRYWRGVPPKSKDDYAFISHMIEATKEREGKVVVVVPHGVLFRGASEGRIREKLIEENLLDSVIGLPANLFPSTLIPVAVLVFDKSRQINGKNENRKDVLFIDASKDFISGKNQNSISDEHLEKILNCYTKRLEIEKYSKLASLDELKENDFNLNIPKYVDAFEEEEEVDIKAVEGKIKTLESELSKVRGEMSEILKELSL